MNYVCTAVRCSYSSIPGTTSLQSSLTRCSISQTAFLRIPPSHRCAHTTRDQTRPRNRTKVPTIEWLLYVSRQVRFRCDFRSSLRQMRRSDRAVHPRLTRVANGTGVWDGRLGGWRGRKAAGRVHAGHLPTLQRRLQTAAATAVGVLRAAGLRRDTAHDQRGTATGLVSASECRSCSPESSVPLAPGVPQWLQLVGFCMPAATERCHGLAAARV